MTTGGTPVSRGVRRTNQQTGPNLVDFLWIVRPRIPSEDQRRFEAEGENMVRTGPA
jgi:hypothetical protein